jgi:hypothetical protein
VKKKIKAKPHYKGPVITTAHGTFRIKKEKQKKGRKISVNDQILELLKDIKSDLEALRQPPAPSTSEDYKPGNGSSKSEQQWYP